MRQHTLIALASAFVALCVGVVLIPRGDEYVTMLARDGRYDEAPRLLLSMRARGDDRPQLLMQVAVLQMKRGDVDGATASIHAYLSARPDDLGALEAYSTLLLQSGRLDEHLELTDRLLRARPDADRIAHLLAQYKLHGRTQDELALLKHFARTRFLQTSHHERLGSLLSALGDWDGAATWLSLADAQPSPGEAQSRLRLLYVLVKADRRAEGLRLAEKWLVAWRSPYLAAQLISTMSRAGADVEAARLARVCAETMPAATLEVASALMQTPHSALARDMLSSWGINTAEPTPQEVRAYIYASLAVGEMQKPIQRLLQLASEGAPTEIQARYLEEITHGYGPQVALQFLPIVPVEVLLARALVVAELAQTAGNAPLAGWFLDHVEVSRLDEQQQDRWLSLLHKVKSRRAVIAQLMRLWESGALPKSLVGPFAAEAGREGYPALHDAIWASLHR